LRVSWFVNASSAVLDDFGGGTVAGGSSGGAIFSAAPDKEQASVQLARLDTTSLRVLDDAPSALVRPLQFTPPTGQIWRSYYYAGTRRMAVRVEGDPTPANNGVFYLLSDHLGSTGVTTDASGTKVAELRYYPYGQTRYSWNTTPTSHRFTGQISDEDSTGLYFYGARYYDGLIGRFISADTIVPGAGNPQSLNRFSYTLNNPLRYIDPTGHTYLCDEECENNGGRGTPPKPKPPKPQPPNGNNSLGNSNSDEQQSPSISASNIRTTASNKLREIALGADLAGTILSTLEASVTDFFAAGAITTGCGLGGLEGCAAGVSASLEFDIYLASTSPLGVTENLLGGFSLLITTASDIVQGNTDLLNPSGPYVGKDTLVSLRNFTAGLIPESNIDYIVSGSQLQYDTDRINGLKSGGSVPLSNLKEVVLQLLVKDWR
jgi:RHS repeat-associated protein